MKQTIQTLKITLFLCLFAAFSAHAEPDREVKADTLRNLQEMRVQNMERLREIDATLLRKIEDSQSINIERDVRTLKSAKKEHLLRQEFLDRLIFQIDTKFSGGDLRQFLERSLTDMAKIDAVNSQVDSGLWKFLKFAADAVRRLPEQKENIVSFLEGYMNRSVANPIRPEDYLSSRNYTNGSASESGSPIGPDEAGALADRRLEEMGQQPVVQPPEQN